MSIGFLPTKSAKYTQIYAKISTIAFNAVFTYGSPKNHFYSFCCVLCLGSVGVAVVNKEALGFRNFVVRSRYRFWIKSEQKLEKIAGKFLVWDENLGSVWPKNRLVKTKKHDKKRFSWRIGLLLNLIVDVQKK